MFTGGRPARLRRQALDGAITFLKHKDPSKFAAAQVRAYEDGNALEEQASKTERRFGSPERFNLTLQILDIQATAYLDLVSDMASQESYMVLLNAFGDKAFENQTGLPLDAIAFIASPDEIQAIRRRAAHWVNEGYKKVRAMDTAPKTPVAEPVNARKQFVEPILLSKGWSVADWAKKASVAHATAMDYLDGKTDPFPDTKLKLATALNVPVERLP